MAPGMPSGSEPRQSPKPEPLGNFALLFLFTTCTTCALFLIWRKASSIRTIVAHRLNEWSGGEGGIRLSTDDGPPAREFLDETYDDEEEEDRSDPADDEPLPSAIDHNNTATFPPPQHISGRADQARRGRVLR